MALNIESKGTFKTVLMKVNNINYQTDSGNYMYVIAEIISVNNTYYFAKELATGEIFPVYNVSPTAKGKILKIYSFLKAGEYFIYTPIEEDENNFEYKFVQDAEFQEVDLNEIEKYMHSFEQFKGNKKLATIRECSKCNIFSMDYSKIKNILKNATKSKNKDSHFDKIIPKLNTVEISKYGYDLSKQNNLCDVVGREAEIKKVIKSACIKEKSVLLIGEPGSGKTSIIEKIAKDIDKIEWLNGKTIFYLNTSQIIAGTRYRGDFETELNKVLEFCKDNKGRIILFIDEIHTLYGLGKTAESAIDAMQILKPYISSGEIVIIGATTTEEYNKYLTEDPAFCRRFDKVDISVPDRNLNYQIILSYIKELEEKYSINLNIEEESINSIINSILDITDVKSQKVINDVKIQNPTLAKSVIEDAFVEAKYNHNEEVSTEDIVMAIIECDRILPARKKEIANDLKSYIQENNNDNIVTFTKIKKYNFDEII